MESEAQSTLSSQDGGFNSPLRLLFLEMPPQTLKSQKSTSFEVWQENLQDQLLFIPVLPAQAGFEKTEVGENESQCQILTRQKNNCFSPWSPPPALAL